MLVAISILAYGLGAPLSGSLIDRYGVEVVPITVTIDGVDFRSQCFQLLGGAGSDLIQVFGVAHDDAEGSL